MTDLTEEQQRHRADLAQAARVAMFAVDDAFLRDRETADALRTLLTPAERSSLTVEAALGYLIGQGLIEVRKPWPAELSLLTPEYLRPDVDGYLERARTRQAAMAEWLANRGRL